MTARAPLQERVDRYHRLKRRIAAEPAGEGMTLEQAGALEKPRLSRARVSAIVNGPEPEPFGRPSESPDRDNLRARLRYWQRKRAHATTRAQEKEIVANIDALQAEIDGL